MSFLDHLPVCRRNRVCKKCGREGCDGCILHNDYHRESDYMYPPEKVGLCVICSGMYTEDEISMHPPKNQEWNCANNKA